ncbi:MAG: dual CXXC motif small (seleno)protein [Dissulfuribacterales bacterium]
MRCRGCGAIFTVASYAKEMDKKTEEILANVRVDKL